MRNESDFFFFFFSGFAKSFSVDWVLHPRYSSEDLYITFIVSV